METNFSIFYILNIIIHTLVYIYFILAPFKNKLRYSVKITVLATGLYLLFVAIIILLFFEKNSPFSGNFLIFIMWIVLSIVLCIVLIKGNPIQMVFIIFVTFNIQNSVIVIASILDGMNIFPKVPGFDNGTYLLLTITVLALHIPIMKYIYINLFKKVIDTNINFSNWKYLWLIPVSAFVFSKVSRYGGISLSDGMFDLNELFTAIFLEIMGILSYAIALQMLLKTYDSLKATQAVNLAESQLNMQKQQYLLITNYVEQSAKLRHDWRHHMRTLLEYAKSDKLAELKEYLSIYNQANELSEDIIFCDNIAVNAVLRYHFFAMQKENINTKFKVELPEKMSISDMDLCVIFGNLTENAVEACLRQTAGEKFITIKSSIMGKQLLIEFTNSFEGQVREAQGTFLSTKHEGNGIGISSVKSIVEKCSGFLKITSDKQVFVVKVMLNI